MTDYTLIPLSKDSKKYAGKYKTIVSIEDADLANQNWCVMVCNHTNYATRTNTINRVKTAERLHRVILSRKLGRVLLPTELVDHINGDGLDNRRENLRLATATQSQRNRRMFKSNKSGYKGVMWVEDRSNYRAVIVVNKKRIHLGYFVNPRDAYKAYCEAARFYFGEYANIDEIREDE